MEAWSEVIKLADHIDQRFKETGEPIDHPLDQYEWNNCLYTSNRYRRAHLQVIDKRIDYKIYIIHATIFPHFNDPSPIWGFDAVCGANKITGAFHDFSAAGDRNHYMIEEFSRIVKNYECNRIRDLPQWAKMIFSPHMIAAGFLREEKDIANLCDLAKFTLEYYLQNVGSSQESLADFHMAQNFYCRHQKKNPHVIRSMVSMGVDENKMKQFVEEVLFPETN